ncbi:MAG: hypothetical protein QOJ32_2489 [Frankiaceae bacterium]|nr:hypothetical protein [Frankiaceae bacterium]
MSVAVARQMLWRMLGAASPMDAHQVDSAAMMSRGTSVDAQEGIASFLEKRPAQFPDQVSTGMPEFYPWWTEEFRPVDRG